MSGVCSTSSTFGGFKPNNISNLELWLSASSGVFTDAGVTPATNGQTVQQWNDKSGNANNASQATSANRPTFISSAPGGFPGIQTGASSGVKLLTPSFLDSTYNTAFSVYAVVAHSDTSEEIFAANNNQAWFGGAEFFAATITQKTNNLSSIESDIADEPASNTQFLTRLTYNGSTRKHQLFLPNSQYSDNSSVTGNLGLSGALTIGQFDQGGFAWNGYIYELLIYKAALSTLQDTNITNYLRTKYSLNINTLAQIYCSGDSLTFGFHSTNPYPAQLQTLLGSRNYSVVNIGINSKQTSELIISDQTLMYPFLGSFRRKNIAILWEITNDLATNQNPTTAYSNVVTWCQNATAAGFSPIVVTCLPRNNAGLYAGFEADRQTVNTNIRNNWPAFALALMDVGADATIGVAGATSNPIYYQSDFIHLTAAGDTIVANYAQTAVLSLG